MTTKEKLIEAIEGLPEGKIRELLRIANGFKNEPRSGRKSKWAEFAGSLSDDDARVMKAAIEEEFEKVEEDAEDVREADKAMKQFERTGKAVTLEEFEKELEN